MKYIIDTERTDQIYRCNNIKATNIYISLIGCPISLIFLLFGIFTMILSKKRISFLTLIIILIFFSESINVISKLLQLLKYYFKDIRYDKSIGIEETARGIICQIQIVTSIFSDFCTLLCTLILSLRCYEVIKYKRRFFDQGNHGILAIVSVIVISIGFAIGLLFLDRHFTDESYRYDVRDRCSYWCWLGHISSMVCFGIYLILIIINIIFACKNGYYLKSGYKKLEENENKNSEKNSMSIPLNDVSKDNNLKHGSNGTISSKQYSNLSIEERNRINELKLMRAKCLIYPWTTIIIWLFAAIYRVGDTCYVWKYDTGNNPLKEEENEKQYFEDRPIAHFFVKASLVLHTFLSSTRGICYGFSFIIFEEKIFFNFFRKLIWEKFFKVQDSENFEEEKELNRNTETSSFNSECIEKKEEEEKSDTNDMNMNNSGFNYNN